MKSVIAVMLFGFSLFAGNESGHGGGSIVKRDASEKILSVELLDFYEAIHEHRLALKSPEPKSSANEIAALMVSRLQKLDPHCFDSLDLQLKNLKLEILDPTVRLEPTKDVFPKISPKQGKIETLANYVRENEVLVDGEIWPLMTENQKAGLILHELVYAQFRRALHAPDSRDSRRLVGFLFSTLSDEELKDWYEHINGLSDNGNAFRDFTFDLSGGFVGYDSGDISTAYKNWEARCAAWKKYQTQQLGKGVTFQYCGQPVLRFIHLFNVSPRYDHGSLNSPSDNHVGWEVISKGQLTVNFPKNVKMSYKDFALVVPPSPISDLIQKKVYISARNRFEKNILESRDKLFREMREMLGTKIFYMDCENDLYTENIAIKMIYTPPGPWKGLLGDRYDQVRCFVYFQ